MNRDQLKEIFLDQKEAFNRKKDLIPREVDMERYIKTSQVVIISGIRRSGKSSLLYLIKEYTGYSDKEYLYFNFDDERIERTTEVMEQIMNLHTELYGQEPTVFFDEVQNIPGWEKFINRIHEKGYKIFITGSNASLLSSEISTSLTGRNMVLKLYPFSFREFLKYLGRAYNPATLTSSHKANLRKDLNEYIAIGGFPLVVKEQDPEILNGYFQDILYRDILGRYKITQVEEIRQIAVYLATNSSRLFSYSTLQKISGIKSTSTVKSYLEYLSQSYLFIYLNKFDYSVKKQQMNSRKAYAIDTGLSGRLGLSFSRESGRKLENIILLDLVRRGVDVFYHKGKGECDFVIREGIDITAAIQVCWELTHENFDREVFGLTEAINTYKLATGQLIVMEKTPSLPIADSRIEVFTAWEWLLSDKRKGIN
jgi:predicted AAA+ superfamily ATPase